MEIKFQIYVLNAIQNLKEYILIIKLNHVKFFVKKVLMKNVSNVIKIIINVKVVMMVIIYLNLKKINAKNVQLIIVLNVMEIKLQIYVQSVIQIQKKVMKVI